MYRLNCTCTGRTVPAQAELYLYRPKCACTGRTVPVQAELCLYRPNCACTGRTVPVQYFSIFWPETDSRSSRYHKRADLQKQSLKRRYIDVYNRPHCIPSCLFFLTQNTEHNCKDQSCPNTRLGLKSVTFDRV